MNVTINPRAHKQGIALVLVMVVIFVLALLAAGFSYSMRVETRLALNANHEAELTWLGRSGVELARYVLGQQMSVGTEPYDSLNQFWAGGSAGTNEVFAGLTLDNVELGNGRFSVKITDLERVFNINLADEMVLRQALVLVGVDAAESSTIVDSILDWIDPDDLTRLSGWESDDYLALPRPYLAKNGPLDDLSELLLVNGVTPEIFWGGGTSNAAPRGFGARRDFAAFGVDAGPLYPVGLVELFSPVCDGRININTASVYALQLIPGIDENIAHGILAARAGLDGVDGTEDDIPFRNVGELINVPGMSREMVGQLGRFYHVRSATFEVRVEARIDQYQRRFVALLRRNSPRDVQVLHMHWE